MSPDDYRRMSGFRRSEAPRAGPPTLSGPIVALQTYDLSDPALLELMRHGRTGVAGVAVNERLALRNSTFFRAMNLIAGSLGKLPLHLMRRNGSSTEKAVDHPLFKVLHRKPNDFQTASRFKSHMQLVALLDGTAYALKIKSRGAVRQLIPLPRKSVQPILSDTFDLTFRYNRPSGGSAILQPDDVFHFGTPLSLDGLNGVSLLDVAADTLSLAVKAQEAAARLLTKGSMARGALETEKELGEEAIRNLKESLQDDYSGTDAEHDFLILEEGLKANLFGTNARDAQHIEQRKFQTEEVSRFTGVPRPLLMFDETSWGSGIEALGMFFVTYCLMDWFVIWEEAIWMWLLTPQEQETYYAKYNEGALLRGSLKDQADFFKAAIGPNAAWMTPNEVRESFDRNSIDGGDDLPRPGTTAAAIAQEDTANAE
jgi:HK97 family phage portal protein